MHRSIATIMLIMVSLFAKAQNYQTITRVVYEQQRISGYNSLNKLAVQVDCNDMVWQVLPDNSIKIWDDIHSFTVRSTSLSVPAFAALGDSLRAWQVGCGQPNITFPTNLDTTQADTSMILPTLIGNFSSRNNDTLSSILQEFKTLDSVYVVNRDTAVVSVVGMKDTLFTYDLDTSVVLTIDSTYYFQLDSIIKLLQKDTMQFEYHSFCYRSKADSGVYEFSQILNVKNPLVPIFMSFVNIDSLTLLYSLANGVSVGTIPNFATDYVPCERWNEYLSSTKQDTLKTLVFKAQTKRIDGTLDTLYNCKGLSFSVSENATGNIILYYGDGDQDVFDVANESLPNWENGSFVEFLGFDASGVAGVLRVNMLGCSQTPDVICAKEKPIVNCATSTPIIICSGWASASGIWSTLSGCWNTGQ